MLRTTASGRSHFLRIGTTKSVEMFFVETMLLFNGTRHHGGFAFWRYIPPQQLVTNESRIYAYVVFLLVHCGGLMILQGCGKFTYLDVRELSAGGIDRFKQKLLASSRAVQAQEQTGSIHNHLETPAQVHLSNISETFSRRSTRYIPLDPYLSQSTQRGNSLVTSASDPDSKFLLLCINTKDSTVLSHVEVASLTNDQHLFEQILIEYKKARENSEFRVTSIIPQLLSNFANTISTRIPRLPYLSKFFSLSAILRHVHQMRLYRIESGDFVQVRMYYSTSYLETSGHRGH